MKAKYLKQYKRNVDLIEVEDGFGDKGYKVEGVIYQTKEEAKKAIHTLIEEEFKSRYIKGSK
jgi:hypothetical protein